MTRTLPTLLELRTPVRLHRAINNLLNGKLAARTTDGQRYDVLLADGLTVVRRVHGDGRAGTTGRHPL